METIIDEIRNKMGRFSGAHVQHDASSILYLPDSPQGFVVQLVVLKKGQSNEIYSVYYNGAHEEFARRDGAVWAFGFGLSTGCRVREFARNDEPYRWVVDVWDEAAWRADWEIFRFSPIFWQFWRPATLRCLQNRLIDFTSGSDPEPLAGKLVPIPPGGGLPSLSAAMKIPKEEDDRKMKQTLLFKLCGPRGATRCTRGRVRSPAGCDCLRFGNGLVDFQRFGRIWMRSPWNYFCGRGARD